MLPLMVFSTVGAQVAAREMRLGRFVYAVPMLGMIMTAAGAFLLAIFAAGMPLWLLVTFLTIISTGMGAIFPLLTVTLQATVAPHDLGTTMALNVFMRSLGSAIGVAVMGAVLIGIAGAAAIGSPGLERSALRGPVPPELARGFFYAYMACGAGFLLAIFSLIRLGRRPLPGTGASGAIK